MDSKTYWTYNIPLQLLPRFKDPEDETSDVVGYTILNYQPRRQRVDLFDLDDGFHEQTREEFMETTALYLEHLAKMFRDAKTDPRKRVSVPGEMLFDKTALIEALEARRKRSSDICGND